VETANSAYAIAGHVVAATRVYALGFGCGQAVERNRSEEFSGMGTAAREAIEPIQALSADIASALAGLTPADLDRRTLSGHIRRAQGASSLRQSR